MAQHDGVRALFGGHRVDALAQLAQPPHALDCVLHLVRLDVLELVDVEAQAKRKSENNSENPKNIAQHLAKYISMHSSGG